MFDGKGYRCDGQNFVKVTCGAYRETGCRSKATWKIDGRAFVMHYCNKHKLKPSFSKAPMAEWEEIK